MEEATQDVINNQIPQIKTLIDQGKLHVDNIDVFCENGVFDTESTRQILEAGKGIGLNINFHGDELHPMKSGEVGNSINFVSIFFIYMYPDYINSNNFHHMKENGDCSSLIYLVQ